MGASDSTGAAARASASTNSTSVTKEATPATTTAKPQTPSEKSRARKDAPASSTSVIGKRLRKSFGARFFWGSVTAHYVIADALFYKIRFDDGDVDVLPAPEVLEDIKMAEKHAREDKAVGSANRKRQARELARTAATLSTAPVAVQQESARRLTALASADAQQAHTQLAPAAAPVSAKRKRTDASEIDATQVLPNSVDVTVYDQRLYLTIITTKRVTRISQFVPRDDGSAGEIEATNRVGEGDIITHINGESILGLDSSAVSLKIREATRPLVIRFYRGELPWTSTDGRGLETSSSSTNSSGQSTPSQTNQGGAAGTTSSHTPPRSAPPSSSDAPHGGAHPHEQHVPSTRGNQPPPSSSYSTSYAPPQQSSQPYASLSAPTYAPPPSSMVPSTHSSLQVSIRAPPPPHRQYQSQPPPPPYQPYASQYGTVPSGGMPMTTSQPGAHTSAYTAAPPSSSRTATQSHYQQQQRVMEMRRAALARQLAQHHAEQQWRSGLSAPQSMRSTSMMRADSAPLSYSNRSNYTTSAGDSQQQSAARFQEVTASTNQHLDSVGLLAQNGQRVRQSTSMSSSTLAQGTAARQEPQRPAHDSSASGDQSPLFSESPVALELQDDDGEATQSEGEDDDAAAAEKELAAVLGLDPAADAAESTAAAATTAPAATGNTVTDEPSPEAAEEMSFLTPSKTSFVAAIPRASSLTTSALSVPQLTNLSQPHVMARTAYFNNVECVIVHIRRQRLLVSLTPLGSFVSLASFLSGPQGERGEIEESGKVCVGDVLVAINGMGIPPNSPVANVAKLLGSMARPFEIYFHRASWDVLEGTR